MVDSSLFEDTYTAYKVKSGRDLWRAYLIFTIVTSPVLNTLLLGILKAFIYLKLPIGFLLKETVFRHFCVGETLQDAAKMIERLSHSGVKGVLDFSVEGKNATSSFERVLHTTIQLIEYAASSGGSTPFVVFKPTGLGSPDVYEKVSDVGISGLTKAEREQWHLILSRFDRIIFTASKFGIPVMVDAEESWTQPAVDQIVRDMMQRYNQDGRILVYNTVQAYRKGRIEYVAKIFEDAQKNNFKLGIKLVRGAYMEKERLRAKNHNYDSPVHDSKQDTDSEYRTILNYVMERLNTFSIYFGTHNVKSCLQVVNFMKKHGIENNHHNIWFGQLYGMSDYISFNLSRLGFNTSKYMPFGPVKETIPYLLRRADENSSVKSQSADELRMIKKELRRRKSK